MEKLVAILLFILPSFISFPLCHLIRGKKFTYGKNSKIGFSVILCAEIHIDNNSSIGSLNFIKVNSISLSTNAKIKYFNYIKGRFDVMLGKDSCINQLCKISSRINNIRKSRLYVGDNSIIGVGHTIDLTHNVIIGYNSILAGRGSQIWTHGFYHPKTTPVHWRIDREVNIGSNVYVGSACIICAGVKILDDITIGAGCTISKNLSKNGLYVNQALRYIKFVPEESIKRYQEIDKNIFEKL